MKVPKGGEREMKITEWLVQGSTLTRRAVRFLDRLQRAQTCLRKLWLVAWGV